jgi:DNA-binding IclR family transcriptional regulator
MMASEVSKADWLRRIRAEYTELPGMVLTESQVKRLWGLDAGTCRTLLDELVRSGFLKRTRTQSYVRASNY